MLLKHDHHSMKEIEHAVTRLSHTGIDTKGFIFNGYVANKSAYGYQDYGYLIRIIATINLTNKITGLYAYFRKIK